MMSEQPPASAEPGTFPKASLFQRFWKFWMPVFDLQACVAEWGALHLAPLDAQALRKISGEAHERERQFHFRRAHSGMIGEHRSPFKGQGMDFAELREYAPGDDIRKLDWQVFARTQVPHIRDYKEERQLTVWLVLEDSVPLGLGPATYCHGSDAAGSDMPAPISDKRLRAYELLLRLGRIAKSANARLGFFLATPSGYAVLKPATGQAQLIRISELLFSYLSDAGCRVGFAESAEPLAAMRNLVLKQDWVLVLADACAIDSRWAKPFGLMSHHSPVSVFTVYDRREWRLPQALESLPLVSPLAAGVKTKKPEYADCSDCYERTYLEQASQMLNQVASVFPVDVTASVEDILHDWASHMRAPFKKTAARFGAGGSV